MKYKAIFIAILCLLVAVLSIQNAKEVELEIFLWTVEVSRILLILISFVIGMAVGILLSSKGTKKQVQPPDKPILPDAPTPVKHTSTTPRSL